MWRKPSAAVAPKPEMLQGRTLFQQVMDQAIAARRARLERGLPDPPDPAAPGCKNCADARYVRRRPQGRPQEGAWDWDVVECSDCHEDVPLGRLVALCGLQGRFITFAEWRRAPALQAAFEAVRALLAGERWVVWLRGAPGVGKTALAQAAFYAHLEAGGTGRWCVVPDLIDDLRETHEEDATESVRSYLERLTDCELLVLDDLGKHRPTVFAAESLFKIVDRRLRERRALIVTTNVRVDSDADRQMDEALRDRLAPGEIRIASEQSRRGEYDR